MKPAAPTMIAPSPSAARPLDVQRVRADFPILHTRMGGRPLIYLDNGATTQKPRAVIDRLAHYYACENSNVHRGVYRLSEQATQAHEDARRTVQRFINAAGPEQVVFTRGTTESINLVASSYGRMVLGAGDEVIISAMEHHSDIVPWQLVCAATGAVLRVIPMNDAGELRLDEFEAMLSKRTKIVAVVHVSNSLGTINDVRRIIRSAHAVGARVLVDGAQWVAHFPTDVQAIDADFYAFSGHKLFGPTGIGVLYGRRELLESMPPYQGGGDMIESVAFERTTYAALPARLEAGTPHIAGTLGLAVAIDYLGSIGFDATVPYEHDLLAYATSRIKQVPGLRLIGTAREKASVISFVLEDPPISAMDAGMALDREGIAVRTGHHCCQPVMDRLGIPGTIRASLAMYNTRDEVDSLVECLGRIVAGARGRRSAAVPSTPGSPGGPSESIEWPRPRAASPAAAADAYAADFELLGDRDARNQHVLDLGGKLPRTWSLLKKLGIPRVAGCMSEVYMLSRRAPDAPEVMQFLADSDADIVRGLIALLQGLVSGQRAKDIIAFDVESFFQRIGLDQFISSQRRNGLNGMVARIKSDAARLARPSDAAAGPASK
jgi:cysteine desulfurase/selenocysteine lyase